MESMLYPRMTASRRAVSLDGMSDLIFWRKGWQEIGRTVLKAMI
ncbi:MAG: hypothetical protein OSJ52_11425 [Lachnospiraceae bacterium]|nr:hypothetical protein [Lachnospiraceae bacterium]